MKKAIMFLLFFVAINIHPYAQVGKVGINTTAPAAMLHVKDSSVLFTGNNTLPVNPGQPPVSGAGIRMMWYPAKAAFRAGYVNASNWSKDSIGAYSVVFGFNNIAKGHSSFASGTNNKASGNESAAFGQVNTASGDDAFAAGNNTTASGASSATFGASTTASGPRSFATGNFTIASGSNSFAAGFTSVASGLNSFAAGNSVASGSHSFATGFTSVASNASSAAFGGGFASGFSSFAMGEGSVASANRSFSFGNGAYAKSFNSAVFGRYNDSTSVSSGAVWVATDPLFIIGNGDVAARSNAITILKNGNMGVGSISPKTLIHVSRSNTSSIPALSAVAVFEDDTDVSVNLIAPAANGSAIFFGDPSNVQDGGITYNAPVTNGLAFRANGNAIRAVIDDVGNFGIGTISPQKLLHVSGGNSGATPFSSAVAVFENNSNAAINIITPDADESGLFFGNPTNSVHGGISYNSTVANGLAFRTNGNSTKMVINDVGDTGIGDNTPNARLHISEGVSGGIYFTNAEVIIEDNDASYLQFSTPTNEESGILSGTAATSIRSALIFRADSSVQIRAGGSTTRLAITNNGDIGMGTLSPAFKLHLSTNSAGKPTSNAWTIASDARLKKDVYKYEDGLEELLKINPVWFTYTGEADMPQETGVGVLAQELQQVAPYMIGTWKHTDNNRKTIPYLSVNNGPMTYMLINAVKEQQVMLNEQQRQIDLLLNELIEIKQKLEP